MTINEQLSTLKMVAKEHGINSPQFEEEHRRQSLYWLQQGEVSAVFQQEETAILQTNYKWVCKRLAELEATKP